MDLNTRELLDVGFDAFECEASELPAGLGGRVQAAVLAVDRPRRHLGWQPAGDRLTSHAAFIRTAVLLAELLDSLTPDEWAQPTQVFGVPVRGLITHLVGVERYVLGQLGRRPALAAPRREDHFAVAMQAASDLAGAPDSEIARAWWLAAMNVIAACGELGPDHPIEYHHLAGAVGGVLLVRTFELWTHGDDIRRATGRPLDRLDEERLALMVGELMGVLCFGMAIEGTTRPGRTARIKLSGPGGGVFDVALAPDEVPGQPDVTISTEALQLCRFAANRLPAEDLELVIEGDRSLVGPMLVGAVAFAAD